MIDAPLAIAFTAGMVATVNPCGFAMLPAYLSYFLEIERTGEDSDAAHADARSGADGSAPAVTEPSAEVTRGLLRALLVGSVVSAGFLLLFAVAGAIVSWSSFAVEEWSPWLTVVIGLVLAVAGVAFVLGWEPVLALPRLDKGGRDRGLWSMFLFGLSYAIASLSCTIGPFTGVVAKTFSHASFLSGIATFLAYGLGMALLLMVLTIAIALARQGLVVWLRRALPYVHRVSGGIMVLMGLYLTWYGIYEIRLIQQGKANPTKGPVGWVTGWSADVSDRLDRFDPTTVALVLALIVMTVVFVALLRAGRTTPHPETAPDPVEAVAAVGAQRQDVHQERDGDSGSAPASSSPPTDDLTGGG